ncbi:MAG: bifunctional folylpolyglutamate synthase/dihydrofolate synthase [Deltaproteobacteria bacterium]|nr:bifunctional folylpolyglutamate synthase/dihydrofolate synthase [Candidatus Anaeroferrophillus wilburensis]MBN2888666.1 bifunctional folylpolyglutamate synthase/dihydrofolate synthase [Deltaproteobacteria bacterium]
MDFQQTLEYLYNLEHFGISLGLENISQLTAAFANPQDQLPIVHVAGSNGKGSTISFLKDLAREAGLKVGVYTSPHLRHFSERIVVDGNPITEEEIVSLTRELKPVAESIPRIVTFFDFTTAMALIHFYRCRPDLVILETGLGGTLDATNVVASPLLTIITNIALEHEEYLGNTLLAVAGEKAGILKKRTPLISGVRNRRIRDFLEGRNRTLGGTTFFLGRDFRLRKKNDGFFSYLGLTKRIPQLHLRMLGDYQKENAALALCALELLQNQGLLSINDDQVRKALEKSHWPARLEKIGEQPDFYVDGAHNPHGVRALEPVLRQLAEGRRLILVIGAMKDKRVEAMVSRLAPLAAEVIVTRAQLDRSCSTEQLYVAVKKFCPEVFRTETIAEAVELARGRAGVHDLVFLTGSLYCVGEALQLMDNGGKNKK